MVYTRDLFARRPITFVYFDGRPITFAYSLDIRRGVELINVAHARFLPVGMNGVKQDELGHF